LYTIPAKKARKDEITLVHTDERYDFIQGTEGKSQKIHFNMPYCFNIRNKD